MQALVNQTTVPCLRTYVQRLTTTHERFERANRTEPNQKEESYVRPAARERVRAYCGSRSYVRATR